MANKIDSVKVSVNKAGKGAKKENPRSKSPKSTPPVRAVSNGPVKKAANKPSSPKKKASRNNLSFFFAVFFTAVIVGGGVFAWQRQNNLKTAAYLKEEAKKEKNDLEKRLAILKESKTDTESSNVELRKTLEDLKSKAALLIGSKKEFKSDDLGVSFEYPASFGSAEAEAGTTGSSTGFMIRFANNDKLSAGGIKAEYEGSGEFPVKVFELKGFLEKSGKKYLLGPGDGQEFEVKPAKVIEYGGQEAWLVDKNSFSVPEGEKPPVAIGENAAAVINLDGGGYPGMVFLNSDFGMMSLDDFIKLIESIRITNNE